MAPVLLLAFDTATPAVTVAITDGTEILAEHTEVDARRHGELLAPGITLVLQTAGRSRSELTDIAVGVGPGPFTGLRVGLVTARVLGEALGIRVHGVCTLDIVAAGVRRQGPFAVATDARRREVYWARYDDAVPGREPRRVTDPAVDWPHVVAPQVTGLPVAGEGPVKYPDAFPDPISPQLPAASALALHAAEALARGDALLPPQPLYLRRPDAVEPGARKPVSRRPALR
jgi:tRNA threonylcarbamoyl adenosine modification protein YeaZ